MRVVFDLGILHLNGVGAELIARKPGNVVDPRVVQSDLSLLDCENLLCVQFATQRLSIKGSVHLQLTVWS